MSNKDDSKSTIDLDYKSEYHRQQEIIYTLTEENNKLKQALVNLALKV